VEKTRKKNAAAVELANLRAQKLSPERRREIAESGGLVGGAARAKKLSPAKRKAIAKKAAQARWGKRAK
jgi:hypothetical protein